MQIHNTGPTAFDRIELSDTYASGCVSVTGAQTWPASLNVPPSVQWNNIGPLAAGAQTSFWIDFRADAVCSAQTNEDIVTVSGNYLQYNVTRQASAELQIKNYDPPDPGPSEDGTTSPIGTTQSVVVNDGAVATWRYNDQPGRLTSDKTWNPGGMLWLPVIRKG